MIREEFIEAAGSRYDWLQALNDGRDFYDYEKKFITNMGRSWAGGFCKEHQHGKSGSS